ncbi:MAG: FAD-dependent oxidoreductase [Desulfobulbaceae bacterium]|nr:FAD-dependent oxidoreductase [Desulfobulbaceae bacterium]
MATYDYDLGVIGGGAAGLTVTAGAAQLGAKVLLIEQEPLLGGDCLHFGCVPSKTLIKTAAVYHHLQQAERYGLPKISVPPVEFATVAARIRNVIQTIQPHDSPQRFCKLGARVEFGHAAFSDEHTVRIYNKSFTAKQWLIATGSTTAIPKIKNLEQTPYLTNREIFSLEKLPRSLIILGGGPIAIEMAQAFCRLGSRVEVIQRSNQILSKEDKDMADLLMARLTEEGVTFHLNTTIKETGNNGSERSVTYTDSKGNEKTVHGEQLLVAMGRNANTKNMGLPAIDLAHSPGGIVVDRRLRTSHHHIYAAGDVTGNHQFTHAAGYEGGIVISNAIFHLPRKTDYRLMPWCTYTEPELASIGMNEKAAQKAGIEYTAWVEDFANNDRSLAEGERMGKIKLILDKNEHPIGVQILGLHGGDLIGEWVAALNGKIKLSTMASAIHPYPTLAEINKRVAGAVLSKKIFSAKVRKILTFLFSLRGRACEPEQQNKENK